MKKLLLILLSIVVVPGFLVGGERERPTTPEALQPHQINLWRAAVNGAPADVDLLIGVIDDEVIVVEYYGSEPDGIAMANARSRNAGLMRGLQARDWQAQRACGATDSKRECAAEGDKACRDSGHEGGDKKKAEITTAPNGCKTCSVPCSDGSGAVALISELNCGEKPGKS